MRRPSPLPPPSATSPDAAAPAGVVPHDEADAPGESSAREPDVRFEGDEAIAPVIPLGAPFRIKPALWYFLPAQLERSALQGVVAMPRPTRGSGDFVSLLGTDGFVELPPGPADEVLAAHDGLTVDYAVALRWKRY